MAPHDLFGFSFSALGCTGRIRIAGVAEQSAQRAVADAVGWLRCVEMKLSRFRAESLVGRINAGETVTADADLQAVLAAAGHAHDLTQGRYDATALPLWLLWHDVMRTTWPSDSEIIAAQARVAWSAVQRDGDVVRFSRSSMALDLGGVGKEWCVDQMLARLQACGCGDVLVELGGDCAARGAQPGRDGWFVLLPGAAAAVTLHNEALATSGIGTRRRVLAGRAVSHLIDVRSGCPAPGVIRSTTVLGDDCLTAGIHASDCCLLAEGTPAAIAERSGGHPTWVRASDGTLFADPRLLARVHPVASDAPRNQQHLAPLTTHLARSA